MSLNENFRFESMSSIAMYPFKLMAPFGFRSCNYIQYMHRMHQNLPFDNQSKTTYLRIKQTNAFSMRCFFKIFLFPPPLLNKIPLYVTGREGRYESSDSRELDFSSILF